MPDYHGLLKVIKQAGVEAGSAAGPVTVCFGKVISASPLKVLVDQKMTLGTAQLVLTRNVTVNALAVGEELVLLRQQGGQKYIIIDRVGYL